GEAARQRRSRLRGLPHHRPGSRAPDELPPRRRVCLELVPTRRGALWPPPLGGGQERNDRGARLGPRHAGRGRARPARRVLLAGVPRALYARDLRGRRAPELFHGARARTADPADRSRPATSPAILARRATSRTDP